MKKTVKLLALACALGLTPVLQAIDLDNVSSSATVVPGQWNSNFAACRSYAEANGVPLLILWSSEGCAYCNKMKTACNKSTFVEWRQKQNIVFAFSENDASSKSFAKNSSGKFPYMRLYWPAGNVDVRFSGRSTMIPVSASTLEGQLIKYVETLLKNYNGGTGGSSASGGSSSSGSTPGAADETTLAAGDEWNKARKLVGTYCDSQGNVVGRVLVTAGKMNAKTGVAKVKLQIQNPKGSVKTIGTKNLTAHLKTHVDFSNNFGSSSLTIEKTGALSGSVTVERVTYQISNQKTGGSLAAGTYQFMLSGNFPQTIQNYTVLDEFLPMPQGFTSNGARWTFARKATPRYDSKTGNFVIASTENTSGLKLSYSAITGYFKGSFVVYAAASGSRTLKRYTATVGGYVVGTKGYGTATIRNVGSYPCTIGVGK